MTTTRPAPPFRFSLQAVEPRSRREWIELVKRVDGAGFDMLVTADHLGASMSPLVPLAVAAENSERLRLGVMVVNNDFRHPALLARSAATLDLLCGGRVELGLGAGHAEAEYARAGLTFDPPDTRIARLEEAVVVLRRLFDGETVTVTGAHYKLDAYTCDPRPAQSHLPILVGGAGRRVHAVGARHADGVGFTGLGTLVGPERHDTTRFAPHHVDQDVTAVRAAAGGRSSVPELQVLVQGVAITDHGALVAEQIAGRFTPPLQPETALATPYLMIGSVDTLVDRLLEHRERWGFSHYTVRAPALGQIEPVIAALSTR